MQKTKCQLANLKCKKNYSKLLNDLINEYKSRAVYIDYITCTKIWCIWVQSVAFSIYYITSLILFICYTILKYTTSYHSVLATSLAFISLGIISFIAGLVKTIAEIYKAKINYLYDEQKKLIKQHHDSKNEALAKTLLQKNTRNTLSSDSALLFIDSSIPIYTFFSIIIFSRLLDNIRAIFYIYKQTHRSYLHLNQLAITGILYFIFFAINTIDFVLSIFTLLIIGTYRYHKFLQYKKSDPCTYYRYIHYKTANYVSKLITFANKLILLSLTLLLVLFPQADLQSQICAISVATIYFIIYCIMWVYFSHLSNTKLIPQEEYDSELLKKMIELILVQYECNIFDNPISTLEYMQHLQNIQSYAKHASNNGMLYSDIQQKIILTLQEAKEYIDSKQLTLAATFTNDILQSQYPEYTEVSLSLNSAICSINSLNNVNTSYCN